MAQAKKKRAKTALPGASRLNAYSMEPEALTIVGLDSRDGPDHPLWDERIELPVDEGLVRNIRAYGVLKAVLVRKNGPLVEVVDGRQRVRAAREANKRLVDEGYEPIKVPCFVRRDKDHRAMGVMISTNENRIDDSPIVRAQKAQRSLDMGNSEEEVCIQFGITKQGLKNLLTVLDLDEKVQNLIEKKKLTYSAAITLTDLTREEQVEKAKEMAEAGVSVAEAKRQARVRKQSKPGAKKPKTRGKSVGINTLRKIADDEEFMGGLNDEARSMLCWILGDESAVESITGLKEALGS